MDAILGLDISTTVIGCSVVDMEGNPKYIWHIDLRKQNGLIDKAGMFRQDMATCVYDIAHVAIEEPLVMYRTGGSSAQIISMLAQFNGMCSIIAAEVFGTTPVYYNVNTARKLALPGTKFPKGENRKQIVLDTVTHRFGLPVDMTKTGKPKAYMYDEADATVIALAHQVSMRG